ncbi:MAG: response regulator [Candidatus Riflebacteria bacterium]|nr:response regulator [Candidatus Riflebacteria bacterium]
MKRLLIVDDNQQNLYIMQLLLSSKGYLVRQASNGTEALESAHQAPPDMIISDILMPVMDGYALCRAWKEDGLLKNIPFVFYTATYTDHKDEEFALSLGADLFIIKPVEPEKFLSLLSDISSNFEAGKQIAAPKPADKSDYYIGYNAVLVRKLEGKMLQLEEANRLLERDIAERKLAEAERQKLEEQLIQARKMEAIGRLAGGIAHDFNNMLGVILGCAELALVQLSPVDKTYALIDEIRVAARRSAGLTHQLLTFARRQPVCRQVLALNESIVSMVKILQRLIGENVELVLKPGANLWPVKMDPSHVDQILDNLCVNASDSITGAGQIIIETNNIVIDKVSCGPPESIPMGEYVRLMLRDTGCGMDKETQSHLFEPFFTTKDKGRGTGLGLATVYGAVKQNDGYIRVISASGQGTTFEIYLPRHSGHLETFTASAPETPPTCGQETLLLVEDDPRLMEMTRTMLESMKYHVLSAGTSGEAIRLADNYGSEIHLLLSDVALSEMNGMDLFKLIQSRRSKIRSLFLSGNAAAVIASGGPLQGTGNFLPKPFSMNDLAAKVREVLDRKQVGEE